MTSLDEDFEIRRMIDSEAQPSTVSSFDKEAGEMANELVCGDSHYVCDGTLCEEERAQFKAALLAAFEKGRLVEKARTEAFRQRAHHYALACGVVDFEVVDAEAEKILERGKA